MPTFEDGEGLKLERRGLSIGADVLLIIARCLALDETRVTHDTREFERAPGLIIEDWLVG